MSLYGHLEAAPGRDDSGRAKPYVRPSNLLLKVLGPLAVALGRQSVLVVRGRTTGRTLKVPMDPPFGWGGARYLVSPRGETHWARNLRAAGEADLRTRGGVEHILVTEIGGSERDEVVRAYASTITCACRRSMDLLPDPSDHPVFRIGTATR